MHSSEENREIKLLKTSKETLFRQRKKLSFFSLEYFKETCKEKVDLYILTMNRYNLKIQNSTGNMQLHLQILCWFWLTSVPPT